MDRRYCILIGIAIFIVGLTIIPTVVSASQNLQNVRGRKELPNFLDSNTINKLVYSENLEKTYHQLTPAKKKAVKSYVMRVVGQIKNSENPKQFYNELPLLKKKATMIALKVVDVEKEVEVASLSSRSVQINVYGTNLWGDKVWGYFQEIYWEWDDKAYYERITYYERNRWGEVYYPFWHFGDHLENSENGGISYQYYEAYTRGWFYQTDPLSGTILDQSFPWIDLTVYPGGDYSYTTSAS